MTPQVFVNFNIILHGLTLVTARKTITRARNESKEEKHARKTAVKHAKEARRVDRKATKEQFDIAIRDQKKKVEHKGQRIKKL